MDRQRVFNRLCKVLFFVVPAGLLLTFFLHFVHFQNAELGLVPSGSATAPSRSSVAQLSQATASTTSLSLFEVQDEDVAYLGKRPDVHTLVNATNIIEACQGDGPLGWRDTRNCLDHLRYNERAYSHIDSSSDFDCDVRHPVKYHTYWRGPVTWRVSFMIKSWLFTQNLKCSQMHIWLDANYDPGTVETAMQSPVLTPFLPLVESGLIVLRAWTYPAGVYIPPEYQEDDFNIDNVLHFRPHQIPRGAVAVSDSVRFIILHKEGGLYLDMDTMFLRDMRPLLITPDLSFAERWGAHAGAGEYNTAYLRLSPNSSLSSRIIQGAAKMGINFHPRILGRMLAKTGHNKDLLMFETALFDPLWSEFDKDRLGLCCTPCLTNFGQFFEPDPIDSEWSTLPRTDSSSSSANNDTGSNRTLSNFYKGAYTHHVHNQWKKHIIPRSWVWVADESYNQFFLGSRTNPYGEYWKLPQLQFSA